jgi:hypothetical protein
MHGKMNNVYRIIVGKPLQKISLGKPKRDGRIILKCILKK